MLLNHQNGLYKAFYFLSVPLNEQRKIKAVRGICTAQNKGKKEGCKKLHMITKDKKKPSLQTPQAGQKKNLISFLFVFCHVLPNPLGQRY